MDKILFFSPYYGIIDWAKNSYFLKEKIFKNADIRSISCNSILNENCVAIQAHSGKFSKEQICTRCISNRKYYNKDKKEFIIEDYLNDDDKKNIKLILKKITRKNFLKFKYQGFKIGRISVHENFIQFRKEDFELSIFEFNQLKMSMKNILFNIFALNKIIEKFKPDILITENGHYSLSRLYVEYFKKLKCKTYAIDASPNNSLRSSDMHMYKNCTFEAQGYLKKHYKKISNNHEIKHDGLKISLDHFRYAFLSKALRNFSKKIDPKNTDVRKYFKIDKNQKIILLSTSSYDEVTGTSLLYFKNPEKYLLFSQVDALKKAIKFVTNNKNYFLIIRQHPRDSQNSSVTHFLKSLKKLPNNLRINTMKDDVSVYNILLETDLVLNSWSSVGLESSILGIPTFHLTDYFTHFPNFSKYDFKYFVDSKSKSFKFSNKALINCYKFIHTYYHLLNIPVNKRQSFFFDRFLRLIDRVCLFFYLPSFRKFFLIFNNPNKAELKKIKKSIKNYESIIYLNKIKKKATKIDSLIEEKIIFKNYTKFKKEMKSINF
tara:strand:- start:692 stop:2329 length:1638 start_codon:yes stop_codon:yes gene_type:complete